MLDPAAEDGARVWLRCKVQDGPPLAVAALRCGGAEAQALDLILDQYSEFTVEGPAPIHVTGASWAQAPVNLWCSKPGKRVGRRRTRGLPSGSASRT